MNIFDYRFSRLILLFIIVFGIYFFGMITNNIFIAYFYGGLRAIITDPLILIPSLIIGAIVPKDIFVVLALIIFGFIFSIIINLNLDFDRNYPIVHIIRICGFLCMGYFARSIRYLIIKK